MTDEQLIHDYLNWNHESLNTLFERHLQKIFNACFRVCLDEQDSNDVTQLVLLKIIKNISKFKWNSSFSTWYFRIAYNESINFLKKKKWYDSIDELENIASLENLPKQTYESITSKEVSTFINTLPTIERNIILYYYYDDLKIREIADIMDINENTVKTKMTKAKKVLSPQLKQYENNY